jgi:hypothetical protein
MSLSSSPTKYIKKFKKNAVQSFGPSPSTMDFGWLLVEPVTMFFLTLHPYAQISLCEPNLGSDLYAIV